LQGHSIGDRDHVQGTVVFESGDCQDIGNGRGKDVGHVISRDSRTGKDFSTNRIEKSPRETQGKRRRSDFRIGNTRACRSKFATTVDKDPTLEKACASDEEI
jgi:hypothetical protein